MRTFRPRSPLTTAPRRPILPLLALLACLAAAGCARGSASLAPRPFDPAYQSWNETLVKYATPDGVDYAALAADPDPLWRTIAELRDITPHQFGTWSRAARLACLINAHNAYALKRIVDHWPVKSLRRTRLALPARDARDAVLLGRRWSLRELEERIMSDEFMESRAIFLLNWGERGCAPLPIFPVTELNLRDLLDRQTRAFINDPRYVRYAPLDTEIYVSPLLDWYGPQLTRDFTTLWVLIGQYLPEAEAEAFSRRPPRIHFLDFDRGLNRVEQAIPAEARGAIEAGVLPEPGAPAP
ncbi:MAG: hypothetical protein BWZ08_00651 [candidate division BRC1 bacterium ADurb.BinA292]|nr:MAG: hypothetical protein BWZ08_00651 [candidate division BRC1 bacterium ADurb.BinA292]